MNPTSISVWNLPFIRPTLMLHVAAIVVIATSLMRAGACVARREVDRFLGTAAARDFEGPADAILYSMDSPTMRGKSGWLRRRFWRLMGALDTAKGMLLFRISRGFFAAVISEIWVTLRRFFSKPLGRVIQ